MELGQDSASKEAPESQASGAVEEPTHDSASKDASKEVTASKEAPESPAAVVVTQAPAPPPASKEAPESPAAVVVTQAPAPPPVSKSKYCRRQSLYMDGTNNLVKVVRHYQHPEKSESYLYDVRTTDKKEVLAVEEHRLQSIAERVERGVTSGTPTFSKGKSVYYRGSEFEGTVTISEVNAEGESGDNCVYVVENHSGVTYLASADKLSKPMFAIGDVVHCGLVNAKVSILAIEVDESNQILKFKVRDVAFVMHQVVEGSLSEVKLTLQEQDVCRMESKEYKGRVTITDASWNKIALTEAYVVKGADGLTYNAGVDELSLMTGAKLASTKRDQEDNPDGNGSPSRKLPLKEKKKLEASNFL